MPVLKIEELPDKEMLLSLILCGALKKLGGVLMIKQGDLVLDGNHRLKISGDAEFIYAQIEDRED